MRLFILGSIGLLFLSAVSALRAADDTVTLPNCLLSMVDEAEVPAQEAGVLVKIPVHEGQQVTKGELLAQIEDTLPRMQYDVAAYKLKVAQADALNDIDKRFAVAAAEVAKADYDQAIESNRKVEGSVPLADVRRRLLEHRKMVLSIEAAEKKLTIAAFQVQVSQAELQAAEAKLKQYRLTAPLDAVVVELSRHEGEWVQPGDPVMRLVRLDRLRVEGFLNVKNQNPAEVQDQPVSVTIPLAGGRQETVSGRIVYVKPLVEAGGEFLVRAEIDNRKQNGVWVLRPGQSVQMTIQLK